MLRRWIPMLGVAVVLLAADSASASLRDRLANRRGYSYAPVYYQANVPPTVTSSEFVPVVEQPMYYERTGRLFGRRTPVYSSGPAFVPPATTSVTAAPPAPVFEQPVYTERSGRLFGRRAPVYYYNSTAFVPPSTTGTMTSPTRESGRRSFYPNLATSNTVLLNVRLPANAELLIEGQRMSLLGPSRQFMSPTLDPNREYKYELTAKWMENGKEVVRTRTMTFKPGRELDFDFLSKTPIDTKTP